MEIQMKEECSFLPHDLIDDIDNKSYDSTEEISQIMNRQDEISQFNSTFQNQFQEEHFNHCQSFFFFYLFIKIFNLKKIIILFHM